MNLEDQVTSLELSMKLKEIGIKQESLFYWILFQDWKIYLNGKSSQDYYRNCISAFTVAELGEMLPKSIMIKTEEEEKKIFSNFRIFTRKNILVDDWDSPEDYWTVNYICDTTDETRNWLFHPLLTKPIFDKNEANSRSKMLIYLTENKLMEIKKDFSSPLENSPETK